MEKHSAVAVQQLVRGVLRRRDPLGHGAVDPCLLRLGEHRLHAAGLHRLHERTKDLLRDIAVRRAKDCGHTGRIETVHKIVVFQEIGRRNRNRTQLVKPDDGKPKFIMAFEHQHHAVAALHAE